MPLYENAIPLIRENLIALSNNISPNYQIIGNFTDKQFYDLNEGRRNVELPEIGENEIVFLGRHLYNSRCLRDLYTIDDVLLQIISSMDFSSLATANDRTTRLDSISERNDGYGNLVLDRAVFELTHRRPKAELYSVMPKNDYNKPKAKKPTI